MAINPELCVHPMYVSDLNADDGLRINCTRLRISHRLRIETGRWARIAPENRLCQCGEAVQDEKHVIQDCHLTNDIRVKYNKSDVVFSNFIKSEMCKSDLCFITDILTFFAEYKTTDGDNDDENNDAILVNL